MSYHNSLKLARLWTQLHELKQTIDNEILPIGSQLGLEDSELMDSLEKVSARIEHHFDTFSLSATVQKPKS